MVRIYTSQDWGLVNTFKSLLETYGIRCEVKGGAPIGFEQQACFTELWVFDDSKVQEAQNILSQED